MAKINIGWFACLCRCVPFRFVALVALACLVPLLTAADDNWNMPTPPGSDVIGVIFTRTPQEHGMTFDRAKVQATTIQLEGQPQEAWLANKSVEPSRPSSRSFRFNILDSRFQKGARPVIDLEITYYLPPHGELDVKVDTISGAKLLNRVESKNANGWQVALLHLDNAYFGARVDSNDVAPKLDGFDLRVDSNANLDLRSIRIIGYDPNKNIDWTQMLKLEEFMTSAPGGVYLFTKGSNQKFKATLQNNAGVDRALYYKAQISGYDDKVRLHTAAEFKIPARTSFPLDIIFDASEWPLGPYDGKIDFYLNQSDFKPIISQSFRLGLITSTILGKAREGEFLYGLDPANGSIYATHSPIAFSYYRYMGVDILRNAYDKGMPESADSLKAALADLAKENVRALVMSVPPIASDPAQRQADLSVKTALMEEIGRTNAGKGVGKAQYFELGNEPDLPGFNPNSMTDYANCYYAMYDALKKGAKEADVAPEDIQIMPGGLSFAGPTGDSRSREFLQILDINKVDIIAYHGHGPGINSERTAYLRAHDAADKYGKAVKPFAETESGVSVSNRTGLIEQARTVVEKMTYAQSIHEPFFMFFRLFMEGTGIEGGYGLTDNFVEPHPSVLSYRNMVERLRHSHYIKSLNFSDEIGAKGIDAYVFEELDSKQEPIGHKTVVAFCENPVEFQVRLQMDQLDAKISSPILYDMFGNPTPIISAGNTAAMTIGQDPIYLSWNSSGRGDEVNVAPAVLAVNANAPVLIGATTSIPFTVRNPEAQPLMADLTATVQAQVSAQIDPATQKFSLPPAEQITGAVNIRLDQADRPLELPFWWKVFLDVDYTQLTPAQLASLPETLPGKSGPTSGDYIWAENNHIDFGKIAGSYNEKRPALAYAVLDSTKAVSLNCGANGDWWMAWFLNGQPVYDTIAKGNLEHNLAAHSFTLPLKPGRNILCVAVLSGSLGWSFDFGGPKELQIAQANGNDPDTVTISLKTGDRMLANQKIPLKLQDAVPRLGEMTSPNEPTEWMPLEPLAVLGSEAVTNYWVKEPDSSKWYKGKKDLSGIVWLRDDGNHLQLFAVITDDKLVQATTPADLPKNDSMRIVLVDDAGKPLLDTTAGMINNSPVMTGSTTGVAFTTSRHEDADNPTTCYHLTIPKAIVGNRPFHFNIAVADNDSNFLKQILELGNVEAPIQGKRLVAGP